MENDTAPTGDNALNGFASLGMLFQGLILHFLHHFKALGLLTLFLRDGLIGIGRHNGVDVVLTILWRKSNLCKDSKRTCEADLIGHSCPSA